MQLSGNLVLIPLIFSTSSLLFYRVTSRFVNLGPWPWSWLAASSFSLRSFNPLYNAVTIYASEIQNLPEGDISTVPSAPIGVCSPPSPLTESPKGLAIALAF